MRSYKKRTRLNIKMFSLNRGEGIIALSLKILLLGWMFSTTVLYSQSLFAAERLVFDNYKLYRANDQYTLDVNTSLRLRDRPIEALNRGVSLYFDLNISVIRQRNWWPDSTERSITKRYRLFYFDLTRHYRVTEISSGESHSFLTLEEAIEQLGNIRGLPLIPVASVSNPVRYRVNMYMALDISELPAPLQLQAYTTRRWLLRSEETEWPLVE